MQKVWFYIYFIYMHFWVSYFTFCKSNKLKLSYFSKKVTQLTQKCIYIVTWLIARLLFYFLTGTHQSKKPAINCKTCIVHQIPTSRNLALAAIYLSPPFLFAITFCLFQRLLGAQGKIMNTASRDARRSSKSSNHYETEIAVSVKPFNWVCFHRQRSICTFNLQKMSGGQSEKNFEFKCNWSSVITFCGRS